MANSDLAIPIVFPDYLISVDTPAINVQVPNGLPWFDVLPDRIRIPSGRKKLPYLGHAGILFANGQSGVTRYFEYGRYDPAAAGGAWMPPVAAPQPAGYIVLVRMIHRDLDFSPGRNPSVANLPLQ